MLAKRHAWQRDSCGQSCMGPGLTWNNEARSWYPSSLRRTTLRKRLICRWEECCYIDTVRPMIGMSIGIGSKRAFEGENSRKVLEEEELDARVTHVDRRTAIGELRPGNACERPLRPLKFLREPNMSDYFTCAVAESADDVRVFQPNLTEMKINLQLDLQLDLLGFNFYMHSLIIQKTLPSLSVSRGGALPICRPPPSTVSLRLHIVCMVCQNCTELV